jgi:hypothetical protein
LVEQLTLNQRVVGSIPTAPTKSQGATTGYDDSKLTAFVMLCQVPNRYHRDWRDR